MAMSRAAGEEFERQGKNLVGGAAFAGATDEEKQKAAGLAEEISKQGGARPGGLTWKWGFLPQFQGTNSPEKRLAKLKASLEKRQWMKAETGEEGPNRFGNASGARLIQEQMEKDATISKYHDIRNRGLDTIEAQEKAASGAARRVKEAKRDAEQDAREAERIEKDALTRAWSTYAILLLRKSAT